ncbi:MAG: LCP family protein [Syntrophomonadales bacterium]
MAKKTNRKKKKVSRYRKILIVAVFFVFSFLVGCSLPQLAGLGLWGASDGPKEVPEIAKGEPVNILFLGIDARPGETNARSDTMMLACINPELQKVAVVSIPRDSRVDVPGALDKINNANAVGGPKAACKAVEKLLGTKVDYYVLTNFNGFAKMIDILGGVTIDVEKRMYKPSEDINLKPGEQHLNGRNALAYVRFRDDALGDIGRTERQQKFLKAFAEEMLKTKTIFKLPSLIPELKENVETNMGTKAMLDLAKLALKFKPDDLVAQTLPGYFYDDPDNGASYWIVDKNKATELIAGLMDGRKVAVIQESPHPTVPKNRGKTPSNQGPINKDPEESENTEEPQDPGSGTSPEDPPDETGEDPGVTPPDNPNPPGGVTNPPEDPSDPGNGLGPEGYV